MVSALLALCGCGYYVLTLWSAFRFLRRKPLPADHTPPVSILKPLRGVDPDLYESLRSHCHLDYPEYEIIFGVWDPQDPVLESVHRLMAEFPQIKMELVICPQHLGTNRKVSNLIQMLPRARYGHLLINDSDIRVAPDYLRRVMAHFADPKMGMVTALYRPVPHDSLSAKLEALGISTEFMGGVLTAREVEGGVHFALGSTLCFSRQALADIGGLEPLLDYLADDFELGARIAAAGYKVEICDSVVENFVPPYAFGDFLIHQLRWGRSTRDSRPAGYTGLLLTFGFPWGLLALILGRGIWWSWEIFALATVLRFALAVVVGWNVLRDRYALRDLWLLPLREIIAVIVWVGSYTGRTVHWRGEDFRLEKGKLHLIHQARSQSAALD